MVLQRQNSKKRLLIGSHLLPCHNTAPVTSLFLVLPQIALLVGVHRRLGLALEGLGKAHRVLHSTIDPPLGRTMRIRSHLTDRRLGSLFATPGASIRNKEQLFSRQSLQPGKPEIVVSTSHWVRVVTSSPGVKGLFEASIVGDVLA